MDQVIIVESDDNDNLCESCFEHRPCTMVVRHGFVKFMCTKECFPKFWNVEKMIRRIEHSGGWDAVSARV